MHDMTARVAAISGHKRSPNFLKHQRWYPTVYDLRRGAQRRLPHFAFEYGDGGAGDDTGIRRNWSALDAVELVPRYGVMPSLPPVHCELFGRPYTAPIGIAPMGSPITQTAIFTKDVEITITSEPAGLTLEADGEDFVTPRTFVWERGTGHGFSTPVMHHVEGSGVRHRFLTWSDGDTYPVHNIIVPNNPRTYSAIFETEYELTFEPTTGGELSPGDGWRDAGTVVQIEATENPYSIFTGWTGTGAGSC